MSDIEKSLQKIDEQDSKKEEIPKHLLEAVTIPQQKFCQLAVTTSMTDKEIANILKVNIRKINKWRKEESVNALMKHLQANMLQDIVRRTKNQNAIIHQKMFAEMLTRFDPVKESDIPKDASATERMMHLKRYAKNADFKDFMKLFIEQSKVVSAMEVEASSEDDEDLVATIRRRFETRRMKKRTQAQAFQNAGVEEEDLFRTLDLGPDGKIVEAKQQRPSDHDVEEEIVTEEISIFKKRGSDE